MEPPSAQSPFAQCRYYPPLGRRVRRLLRGHYSSVIAPTDSFANPIWLFFPSALASCKKSSQVATSPCCHRDLPDVISANLSSDAWSPTTAVPRSAYTCFFLRVIGLPPERSGSASRFYPRIRLLAGGVFEAADISLCSGLRVCSSPRSFLPLHKVPQGSRDFYIRAERASLPLHAPDMLAVRIQAIDGTRTSTLLDSQPCRPLPSPPPHTARPGSRELPVDPDLRSPLGLPVLHLIHYVCMPSPLPRQARWNEFARTVPSTSAFPRLQMGRLLHYQFRGLLSVHSCYNLQTRRVALCDPFHRRLQRLRCLHRRSDCYRVERSSSRAGLSSRCGPAPFHGALKSPDCDNDQWPVGQAVLIVSLSA